MWLLQNATINVMIKEKTTCIMFKSKYSRIIETERKYDQRNRVNLK